MRKVRGKNLTVEGSAGTEAQYVQQYHHGADRRHTENATSAILL